MFYLPRYFYFSGYVSASTQPQKNTGNIEQELKSVLAEWVQNANKKDFEAIRAMLTKDYTLFQNKRRYTKSEGIEMIKRNNLSDINPLLI